MKKQKLTKLCEACPNTFTTTIAYKRYCSSKCRNRAAKKNSVTSGGGREGGKSKVRRCIQCKNPFRPCLGRPEAKLCSRKCQGRWINAQGLGPRHNDEDLLERIVAVINQDERSLSKDELLLETGLSAKTVDSREWSMEFLYKKAGRTYDAPHFSSRFQDRVYSVLCEIVSGLEIENDKPLPGMHGFKKGELLADMFIKDLKLIVEADGKQHVTGRGDLDNLEYIRANDRLKEEYAAANGITLIRIAETVDTRVIRAQLLRGIRRARPGFRPLNPSNALNPTGSTRRMPKRRGDNGRPKMKRGEKGEPLNDVYCRGCHSRPSYKNKNTYLCAKCWDLSRDFYHTSRALQAEDIPSLKEEIVNFVKNRGRYVWHPEVYLYFRPVSAADLKRLGIKVATISRELGLFAPEDDRIGRETVQRVKDFVTTYQHQHQKLPKLTQVLKKVGIDHTTLWSYMDYDAFIAGLGGRDHSIVRYRYRNAEDFLNAAADVVKKVGRSMRMTEIVEAVGISYPAYLANFKSVRSEDIHDRAGVPRYSRKG